MCPPDILSGTAFFRRRRIFLRSTGLHTGCLHESAGLVLCTFFGPCTLSFRKSRRCTLMSYGGFMFSSVLSASLFGLEVSTVRVEADISDGLPQFSMVGYPNAQVREAQERVRSAFLNTHLEFPSRRITVNLSPADIPKSGPQFDFPVALSILAAGGIIPPGCLENVMAVGELSLSGDITHVSGVLPVAMKAKEEGASILAVPYANEAEAMAVNDLTVIGFCSISEAVSFFRDGCLPEHPARKSINVPLNCYREDFADIHGQFSAKRAATIAVAGFHNLLMIGTPGSGKTMIAKRIPTILPSLNEQESLEISRIYSIAGLIDDQHPITGRRPFRHPHHTISPQALAGGGKIPTPGEVSLAHRGVLFLDEMPEFHPQALEILRQPLEDREIRISRTAGSFCFPASFLLLASMNPCPCGYFPDMSRCTCTPKAVADYRNRISGPLLDRIDLSVLCPPVTYEDLISSSASGPSSAEIRKEVEFVRAVQAERFAGTSLHFNSEIAAQDIPRFCPMDPAAGKVLEFAFRSRSLSARSYYRIIRVARTIADLDGSGLILSRHVDEALTFRPLDASFWNRS